MKSVSVIMPVYNASETVEESLAALDRQHGRFEIIIVDDGSTDGSYKKILDFSEKSRHRARVFRQKNSGPASARNFGASKAKTGIIIFLDSDCIVPAGWLAAMTAGIGNDTTTVTCSYRTKNKNTAVARYVGNEIASRHKSKAYVDTFGSYSVAFDRKLFMKLGGFDSSFPKANAEDFDLGYRITRSGYKIAFTHETFVYHYHPETVSAYLKQQFRRGYWRVPLYMKNKDRILAKDSYMGHGAQIQFALSSLFLFSLPFAVVSWIPAAIFLFMLIVSNYDVILYSFRQKSFIAPIILSTLRSLAGTAGAYAFILKKILRRAI